MNCEKSNDRKKCRNFEVDGTPKCQLCIAYREKGSNLNCGKKNVYQIQCKYFEPGGTQKNESERRKTKVKYELLHPHSVRTHLISFMSMLFRLSTVRPLTACKCLFVKISNHNRCKNFEHNGE